jgi:hypothetical protein
MSRPFVFHILAERELTDAVDFYEKERDPALEATSLMMLSALSRRWNNIPNPGICGIGPSAGFCFGASPTP